MRARLQKWWRGETVHLKKPLGAGLLNFTAFYLICNSLAFCFHTSGLKMVACFKTIKARLLYQLLTTGHCWNQCRYAETIQTEEIVSETLNSPLSNAYLCVLRFSFLWQNKTWNEPIEGRTGDVTQSSSPFLLAVVSVKGSFSSWKHYLSPWAWQVSALSTCIRPPAQTRHGSGWPRQQHTSTQARLVLQLRARSGLTAALDGLGGARDCSGRLPLNLGWMDWITWCLLLCFYDPGAFSELHVWRGCAHRTRSCVQK